MSVVAVGDFDGVHRGHCALLSYTAALARSLKTESVVFTFSHNSKSVLRKRAEQRLTTDAEREERIRACGIDRIVTVHADASFFQISPKDFLYLLKDRYGCTDLVGGTDFRYGCGGTAGLRDGVTVCGIRQHVVAPETDPVKISSSAVRALLQAGNVSRAAELLGRPYEMTGLVCRGAQFGRTLGFPTANLIFPSEKLLPADGVYITETIAGGAAYRSVTNIGFRPTVSRNGERTVETHLIRANGDFYGATVTLRFWAYLRREREFSSPEALRRQVMRDIAAATEAELPSTAGFR